MAINKFKSMSLVKDIATLLRKKNAKISTAESCTAGYLSKVLTSISGSSDYYQGSIIAYSNEIKINVLGVEKEIIEEYTEVSEQAACRMAEKIKKIMGTEYSISTTGYADNQGFGTEENPAGTIYIAISTPNETIVKKVKLQEGRERNIYLATIEGLEMIKNSLKIHQVV